MDRRLWRAPLVVVLVGLIMTAVMWQWVASSASARSRARAAADLDRAASWVAGVLGVLRRELDEAERAVRDEPLLAQEDFAARIEPLVDTGAVPGLGAVFFVRPVPTADAPALLAAERAAGLLDRTGRVAPARSVAAERWLVLRQVRASAALRSGSPLAGLDARLWDLHATDAPRRVLARACQDGELVMVGAVPPAAFGLAPLRAAGGPERAGAGPGPGPAPADLWLVARWTAPGRGWVAALLDPEVLLSRLPGPMAGAAVLLANPAPADLAALDAVAWRELDVAGTVPETGAVPFALAATEATGPAGGGSADTVAVACLLLTGLSATTIAVLAWSQRHVAATRSRSRLDELTGLVNRRTVEGELARLVAGGARPAVLFVDIDRFKLINDALGHRAGDEVLRAVARTLERAAPFGAVPARWGGDEFVVVCPSGPGQAQATAERLLDAVSVPVAVPGGEVVVAVSVGLAEAWGERAESPVTSAADALAAADAAMYEAKRRGGGQVNAAEDGRACAAEELRRALAAGDVAVDLEEVRDCSVAEPVGELAGVVVRPRWPAAPGGPAAGRELTELAVRLDLGLALTDAVLARLGAVLGRSGGQAGPGGPAVLPVPLLLPLPDAVVLDPTLAHLARRWLSRSGLEASSLAIGVSERVVAGAGEGAVALRDLVATGVRLHLEGYDGRVATPAALAAAAPAGVALDPASTVLVTGGAGGRGGAEREGDAERRRGAVLVVRAIAAWAELAGVPLSADGVTAPEEAAELASLGVRRVRGPVTGAPAPLECWALPSPLTG